MPAKSPSRNSLGRSVPYASEKAFEKVFAAALAGERIVYHIGHIGLDRSAESLLSSSAREALEGVLRSVMALEQEGRGDPLSRRVASNTFEYAITKRRIKCDGVNWDGFEDENPYKHQDKTPRPPRESRGRVKLAQLLPVPAGATPRQMHEIERSPFTRGAR